MLKLTIVVSGTKMPSWVISACQDYEKRLSEYVSLKIIEIPLAKRPKQTDIARLMEKEAQLILSAIPSSAHLITLEITGRSYSSENLALHLEKLQGLSSHICFVIGGPEGLHSLVRNKADERWSLSALTLPHPLARIIVLESLYRAFSIIHNHPYHK